MGTINYKTSDYITLAEVPIDFNDIESEVRANPEDYGLSDVSERTNTFMISSMSFMTMTGEM